MSQSNSEPLCETEYLLRSPANARRLLAAIKQVEKNTGSSARRRRQHAGRVRSPELCTRHGRHYSSDDWHAFGTGALKIKVA
jgi:hypothetical protein